MIGLGPSILEDSLFSLSIFFGKKISKHYTTELASYNILLWDLKLTVNYFRIGFYIIYRFSKYFLSKIEFKSQNLKPTP